MKNWVYYMQRGLQAMWSKKHTRKPLSERTDYPSYIKWWEEDKKITDEELK